MSEKQSRLTTLLQVLALISVAVFGAVTAKTPRVDKHFRVRPGVTPAEIIRARGFVAEEHFITTTDGYVLKLTRGTNPLINEGESGLEDRTPLLFIHGILEDPVVFVINSFGAEPKDFSEYNLDDNFDELVHDKSARSLPLLAMNLGHECWFLSRRGAPGSQRRVGNRKKRPSRAEPRTSGHTQPHFGLPAANQSHGPSSELRIFSLQSLLSLPSALLGHARLPRLPRPIFDRDFWRFCLDEQAKYDIPQAVDYVLDQTEREKLSIVGHSLGGALTLMSLSLYPELADKIESAVLWSQGFSLGHGDGFNPLERSGRFLESYTGSIPPAYLVTQIQTFLSLFCTLDLMQRTLCEVALDVGLGPSGGKEPLRPEFVGTLFHPTGSHELAQNIQSLRLGGSMHMYDYGREKNTRLYGRPDPPAYNASNIRLPNISFYVGATDTLVTPADVKAVLPSLTVPYKFTQIEGPFNHQGYFYHDDNAPLVILPSLKDIHGSGWRAEFSDRFCFSSRLRNDILFTHSCQRR